MAIHRSRLVKTLYDRSQLLLSDEAMMHFYHYLQQYPVHEIRRAQIDFNYSHNFVLLPKQVIHKQDLFNCEVQLAREPLIRFALEVYLQFFRDTHISLADQVQQQLFSGEDQRKIYQITANNFPYQTHRTIEHCVLWLNPHCQFQDGAIHMIMQTVEQFFQQKGCYCLIFENQANRRSIPELKHYQLF